MEKMTWGLTYFDQLSIVLQLMYLYTLSVGINVDEYRDSLQHGKCLFAWCAFYNDIIGQNRRFWYLYFVSHMQKTFIKHYTQRSRRV